MIDVLIPTRQLSFLLWDWLDLSALLEREGSGHDGETVNAVVSLSAALAEEAFLPHNKDADRQDPWMDANGQVHVLPAIIDALQEYAMLGLPGAGFAEHLGGMELPAVVVAASQSQFMAANLATAAYPMLTMANARLIAKFGDAAQVDAFARDQTEGLQVGEVPALRRGRVATS